MNTNRITETVHTAIPYMFNELFLTDGSALMQHQIFQYASFLTCQIDCNAIYCCNPAFGIICNFSALQADIPLNKLSACKTANSGFQFGKMKWLGKIIICTCIQPLHFVIDFTSCR